MPVRTSQPTSYPGGRVLVAVGGDVGRIATPVLITLVDQTRGTEKAMHLDPRTPDAPWKSAVFWFPPANVRREDGQLLFDLEHGVMFHLRPNAPYLLRLQTADGGFVEERLILRAFRGKSTPPDWQPPAEAAWPSAGTKEPDPDPAPPPPPPVPDAIIIPPPSPPPPPPPPVPTRGGVPWLAVAAVLLVLGGGAAGAWWLLCHGAGLTARVVPPPPPPAPVPAPAPPPAVVPPPPAPTGTAPTGTTDARHLLQEGVSADRAYAEGKRYLEAASLDGAFLLLRHAADKGVPQAAVAVGAMYDPAFHSPKTSPIPTPNADAAASWYRKAAEAGDAEAEYRLGRVLMSGATSDPQGMESGLAWLKKAAGHGHPQARSALPPTP